MLKQNLCLETALSLGRKPETAGSRRYLFRYDDILTRKSNLLDWIFSEGVYAVFKHLQPRSLILRAKFVHAKYVSNDPHLQQPDWLKQTWSKQ